jgi:hypothetical protein
MIPHVETASETAGYSVSGALLEQSIREFETDPNAMGRVIREIFEQQPEAAQAMVALVLKGAELSRGVRYLLVLAIGQGWLGPALTSPLLTLEEALSAARLALQVDPTVDLKLARQLSACAMANDDAATERLLAVLAEVSDAGRIMRPVTVLLGHHNARIRSKAALFVGRGGRNAKWLQRALDEPDPRVRANAVEALWGVDGEAAREVMRAAVHDRNNRVAANALLALHSTGEAAALPRILNMSLHSAPAFRASAAWVMGQTGDPRFTTVLARLISEPSATVRRRAFQSLSRLRATIARRQKQGNLTVAVGSPRPVTGGRLLAAVSVAQAPGLAPPNLLPVHFALSEEGEAVFEYTVEPLAMPEALALMLLLPRAREGGPPAWLPGAMSALARKRPADSWCVLPYDEDSRDTGAGDGPPPQFSADAGMIEERLKNWSGAEAPGLWPALSRAVLATGPMRASRHVVILRQTGPGAGAPPPSLASDARSHRVTIHALVNEMDTALSRLCRETRGVSFALGCDESPGAALERACLRVLPQYSVTWQPSYPPRRLQVQISCDDGWGQDRSPPV